MQLLLTLAAIIVFAASSTFPEPFYRTLEYSDAAQGKTFCGNDVVICQELVKRSPFVPYNLTMQWKRGQFDKYTAQAVALFQAGNVINVTATINVETATLLLQMHMPDNYVDDHSTTLLQYYKYKLFVPVFRNRSMETVATLYDNQLRVLHKFIVRTHGQNAADGTTAKNELSGSGSTPTGLATFDFNTPEPEPKVYGKWPVNRAVLGLQGNAAFAYPFVRNGILLHTGEWENWNPSMPMPNSHGCMHAHPDDIARVADLLGNLQVQARPNPFGQLPYPFSPQGLLSVQLMD